MFHAITVFQDRTGTACRYENDPDHKNSPCPVLGFAFCHLKRLEGCISTWPCMPVVTPYKATAAPWTLRSGVRDVGDCYDEAKTGDCPAVVTIYSVEQAIGNFQKMLKSGEAKKIPLFH